MIKEEISCRRNGIESLPDDNKIQPKQLKVNKNIKYIKYKIKRF